MKKNILTIVVIAVSFINLVLTAVLLFVVVPTSNQTKNLIDQVVSIIDLELQSPDPKEKYSLDDLENVTYASVIQANLKSVEGDKKLHYAVADEFTIQLNKKSDAYKKYSSKMEEYENMITEIVSNAFSAYTYDEVMESKDRVKQDILDALAVKFETIDYVVGISFKSLRFQ